MGLAEHIHPRLPWLCLLWIGNSLEKGTCDSEKQGLKIHQRSEAASCFIQNMHGSEQQFLSICSNLTIKYAVCYIWFTVKTHLVSVVHQPKIEG